MSDTLDLTLQLLNWYREMGVETAQGDAAIDWLARGATKPGAAFVMPERTEAPPSQGVEPNLPAPSMPVAPTATALPRAQQSAPAARPAATRTFSAPPPDSAVAAARAAARDVPSIAALGQALAAFDGCGLKATAKNLCFFRGSAAARLMIIGEAPGREEDLTGTPAAGPAGALLDKMLAAIGLQSADCHITNAVYWRPPGNRLPTPQELDVCRPFLERQVALVAPTVLLVLGEAAARQMIDIGEGLARARGKWREVEVGGHMVHVMASLTPNHLIKLPAHKQHVWRDLLAIKTRLAS